MIRHFTCIICPNGCEIEAEVADGIVPKIKDATCKRGEEYVIQEITNPKRNISSSIKVIDGELPLVSVRLTNPIPKAKIFDVMNEIKGVNIQAPTYIGQIVIKDVLNLNSDVIITKCVEKLDGVLK